MVEEITVQRATVRPERPIYDVLVGVALEKHLSGPRRGPDNTDTIRWLVLNWQRLRSEVRGREAK